MPPLLLDRIILSGELVATLVLAGWASSAAVRWLMRRRIAPSVDPADGDRQASTIIYFWSANCTQCKPQETFIEEARLALEQAGHTVIFRKHNALVGREIARSMHVLTVPTTIVVDKRGKVAAWNPGLTRAGRIVEQVQRAEDEAEVPGGVHVMP